MAILRFAPSPNGYLHLGHAYCALLNAATAKHLNGRFLLRIEDIDTTRCIPAYHDACLEDLAWLGLSWEEPVRIQSQHWDDYHSALTRLQQMQLVYPCFCTRREIGSVSSQLDPEGAPIYPGTCKHRTAQDIAQRMQRSEPHAWRLDMQKALSLHTGALSYIRFLLPSMEQEQVAATPARWGDVILVRKETPTSYHLSVVVDDALQNVTHVIRGQDLESATDLHVLLMRLLGLDAPLYHHHKLLAYEQGEKLSKSKKSKSLRDMRAEGVSPDEIKKQLGF
jgi:glutamyl-Q tRNA(Asp) synthetase